MRPALIVAALLFAGCGAEADAPQPAAPTPTLAVPLHRGQAEAIAPAPDQPPVVALPAAKTSPLEVVHRPYFPTRVAATPDGRLVVSDPKIGSVFIHALPSLSLVGEIKDLFRPLGVAADAQGRIYVGIDGLHRVDVFGPDGHRERALGDGHISMPNDLAIDAQGRLYVADSLADEIKVYKGDGTLLAALGGEELPAGRLDFPAGVAVSDTTLFVADQGSHQVHCFEVGSWRYLRALGEPAEAFSEVWKGRFVKPQALALDAAGDLHVLDAATGLAQVLATADGAFVRRYADSGEALRAPLSLALLPDGRAAVTTAGDRRLTLVATKGE